MQTVELFIQQNITKECIYNLLSDHKHNGIFWTEFIIIVQLKLFLSINKINLTNEYRT